MRQRRYLPNVLALCLFAHGSLLCAQQRQTHHRLPNTMSHALANVPGHQSGADRGNAPPNDEPCGAVPQDLMIGSAVTWTGTFEGATDNEGSGQNSVWESFTLSECAAVTINRCGTTPVQPNGLNFFRGGACDTLTTYHGHSFTTPDCGDGNLVHTYYGLVAGTYFIYLGDMAMGEGTYSLEATAVACAPPPGNDEACAVTPSVLAPGTSVTFQGTLESATDAEQFYYNTVWEAFTLTQCSNIVVDWCGSEDPYFSEGAYLIVGDCAALADGVVTYMNTAASPCGEEENRLSKAYSLPPGTYYLFIPDGYGSSPHYNAVVSAVECIPPPVNDFCADVTPLTLAFGDTLTFEGMVISATGSADFDPDLVVGQLLVPATWHAFTTSACSTVKVSYCGTQPAYDYVYRFLALSCPADSVRQGSWETEECGNGATTITFYDLPAGTYYLPVGRFGPLDWPYVLEVTATPCGDVCAAWAENGIAQYEKIGNVQFAGIDNSSTAGIGYEDFTAVTGDVVAGETYPMTVTISNGNGYEFDQVLVWLDADQSNSFTGNELLYTSPIGTGPFSADILIPADALAGTSRLRVRMHDTENGPSTEPCGGAQYGQVEDYSLNVTVGTGIQPLDGSSLALFPNPNDGRFTVTLPVGGAVRFEVLDLSGRLVHSTQQQVVAGAPVEMDLRGTLAIGSYVLHTFVQDQHAVQHVVIR